ncbi:type VII secretion protein EccC [soil metagenome]
MSVEIVHRSARRTARAPDVSTREVERPPALTEGGNGWGGLLMLVPMLGAGASMTVMMVFRGSSLAAVGALMMILTVLASVVMVFSQRGKATKARRAQREAYLAYLERTRADLRGIEDAHLASARHAQPHTAALTSLVRDRQRLWERRRTDHDYLQVRLGTGSGQIHEFVRQGEDNPIRKADDFMQTELEQLERRFARYDHAPISIALSAAGGVSVVGDREFCDRVARIILSAACTLVSPEDLHMAAAIPAARRHAWDWVTWLPHLTDQDRPTARGPRPRLARSMPDLAAGMAAEIDRRVEAAGARRHLARSAPGVSLPTLLVLADQHGEPARTVTVPAPDVSAASLGISTLHLLAATSDEPPDVAVRISQLPSVDGGALVERYERRDGAPTQMRLRLDDFSSPEASALARQLAGLRLSPDSLEHDNTPSALGVPAMLGIENPANIDVDRAWAGRGQADFLRVPVGVDDSGDPVVLDLKEAAQSGMGPHGLCVGATGSGKSELLRTLVLGLLTRHSPEDVAMVLVDYKGGATFAPFARAPHVHGVITNLGDDAVLIERIYASLAGEVRRRQELLRQAGNLADITAYRRQRLAAGEQMLAMPHLMVIIDEFGELLSARPDFIELFLSIGRIGRSIGVHLLLSSQRIEAGKLRGLETYLSYRIGLRTLSEAESRTVLDTPDAFALPALPGFGYLSVDTTVYTRFRAGFVSGPAPATNEVEASPEIEVHAVPDYPDEPAPIPAAARVLSATTVAGPGPRPGAEAADGPSILSSVVEQLAARPPVGPAVWSQPLPEQMTLDGIRSAGVVRTRHGLRIAHSRTLRVPLGLLDDPTRQRQGPWELDLGAAGNVLIVAGPRSGGTTLLRTLASSIALTHDPSGFVVYGVDALGSNLTALEALPCVAGVSGRLDSERLRRVVDEVHALLGAREALFARLRADSLASARELLGDVQPENVGGAEAGEVVAGSGPMLADVVLLIDGFGPLMEEHPGCGEALGELIRRGPAYGIRVVSTVARWNEARLNQQTFFDTTIELCLADPAESRVGRKLAQTLTAAPPGRCLLASGLFAQVALPRIDGRADADSAAHGLVTMLKDIQAAAPGRVTGMRVLPATVRAVDLSAQIPAQLDPHRAPVAIGIDGSTFERFDIDLDGVDRHLLLMGDPGTGRTSLLRHITLTLVQRYGPDDLVIAQIDPKRSMHEEIPGDHLGGYASAAPLAARLIEAVLPELERRAGGLADAASAFTPPAPRIVVVVDDYDVVTASGSSPLQALVPYVAMAREINLNVIVARRTNGAARGIFEPAYAALRECGATGCSSQGSAPRGNCSARCGPGNYRLDGRC